MTDQKSDFAPINGAEIYYTLTGETHSETMVMLHAGICDHRMWQHQIAHFSERFRVLAFDMRGFGQTKMVQGEFSFMEDLRALLDYLDIQDAWLMGCSQGGKIAINFALTYPDRVKGLLLVAPAISGYRYEGDPHPLEASFDEADEAGDIAQICELEMQVWVDGTGRKQEDVDPIVRQLIYDMNFIPLHVPDELWEQEIETQPHAIDRLETIDKPTLLVVGDLDVPASLERVDILAERVKNAKKVVMQGTAHIPNLEYPDVFNQIVDDFLREL
ncbi:MAG: alpha/beta hydrolase [Aggregatilineales bacterium]